MHHLLYKSLSWVNFDNSVTEKWWLAEETWCGLAEGEKVSPKKRGGSGISTYILHTSRGFRSVSRAVVICLYHPTLAFWVELRPKFQQTLQIPSSRCMCNWSFLEALCRAHSNSQHHQIQFVTCCLPFIRLIETPNYYILTLKIAAAVPAESLDTSRHWARVILANSVCTLNSGS
jgi:hypothetical protein